MILFFLYFFSPGSPSPFLHYLIFLFLDPPLFPNRSNTSHSSLSRCIISESIFMSMQPHYPVPNNPIHSESPIVAY